MNTISFQDRQSLYPRRKKLTVVEQGSNTLIVDVENADQPSITGTPLNSTTMSTFQNNIIQLEASLQNSITQLNTKLNKIKSGTLALTNGQNNFTIQTGLSNIKSINLNLQATMTTAIGRIITIHSISNGNVTCYLRSSNSGNIEGIGNAQTIGACIHWIATETDS